MLLLLHVVEGWFAKCLPHVKPSGYFTRDDRNVAKMMTFLTVGKHYLINPFIIISLSGLFTWDL
jgi:hypothetical protein